MEDNKKRPEETVQLNTCEDDDNRMLAELMYNVENPGNYNLFSRNCATQAAHILEYGGIKVTKTIRPKTLIKELKEYKILHKM